MDKFGRCYPDSALASSMNRSEAVVSAHKSPPNYLCVLLVIVVGYSMIHYGWMYLYPKDPTKIFRSLLPWYIAIIRDVVIVILYAMCSIHILMRGKLRHPRGISAFILFFGVFLLTTVWHIRTRSIADIAQQEWRNVLFYALIYPIMLSLNWSRKQLKLVLDFIVKLGFWLNLSGIAFFLLGDKFLWQGRVLSTFGNPNVYGLFALLNLAILVSQYKQKEVGRLNFSVLLITDLLALYLSFSFTSLIGFVLLSLYLILVYRKNLTTKLLLLAIVGLIVCGSGLLNVQINKLSDAEGNFGQSHTVQSRIEQYTQYMEMASEEGALSLLFGSHESEYTTFDNFYLLLLYNNGFITFILFVFFVLWVIKIINLGMKKGDIDTHYLLCLRGFFLVLLIMFTSAIYAANFPMSFLYYLVAGATVRLSLLNFEQQYVNW